MKYGIVDIGSNTVRLSLFKIYEDNKIKELLNKKITAGLVSYVENGELSKKGVEKLIKILLKFKNIADEFGFADFKVFATASLRNIKNTEDVINKIEMATNLKIDLVSGEQEAWYGYLGICQKYDIKDGLIVDIGGGSTEITQIEDKKIISSASLPEGALSLYTRYTSSIIPKKGEIKLMKKILSPLFKNLNLKKVETIYAIGGTTRATGNICMELNSSSSSTSVQSEEIFYFYESLINQDAKTLRTVMQVSPDRLHTISPGLVILTGILKITKANTMKISKKGIREGYMWNIINS